jgi:uncharacterized protein YndB with AHSA1/START domain
MSTQDLERIEKTVKLVREFDAPAELIFDLFTQPRHMERWWGPREFTASGVEVDLRVGGAWKLVMSNERFGDTVIDGVYRVVERPTRLVFTSTPRTPDGQVLLDGLVTVELEPLGEGTRVTLTAYATGAPYMQMWLDGMEEGWNQSLAKLGEYAART